MTEEWNIGEFLAAIGTLGAYCFYKRRVNKFVRQMDVQSNTINTSFGVLQYSESGSGPALLYSHGGNCGYDAGISNARFLPGIRVISPSRFGYLRSSMPQAASPQLQADAFAHLLNRLGIDRIAVLGTSGGGPAALYFAINHADRCNGLVLLSAITKRLPPFSPATAAVFRLVQNGFIYWILSSLAVEALLTAGPGVTKVEKRLFSMDHDAYLTAKEIVTAFPASLRSKAAFWDVSYLSGMEEDIPVERIQCPVIIFHGTGDRMVPVEHAQFVAKRCAQSKLHLIKNGSHFCSIASRGEVFPIVSQFITDSNRNGTS